MSRLVDIYVLKLKDGKNYVGDVLPLLNNSANTIDAVKFNFIGSKEETLRAFASLKELRSRGGKTSYVNNKIIRDFEENHPDVQVIEDIDFIGVPVTKDKNYHVGQFENKLVFEHLPLEGEFYAMALYKEDYYESKEKRNLDSVMKNDKRVALSEAVRRINHYAVFLLKVARSREIKEGEHEIVLVNYGLIASNDVMTYDSGRVFAKALNDNFTRKVIGKRNKINTMVHKVVKNRMPIRSIVTQTGGYLFSPQPNAVMLPFYVRPFHLKEPTNKRITYEIRLYRTKRIDGFEVVEPLNPRLLDLSQVGLIEAFNSLGIPESISGQRFIGIIEKSFFNGFTSGRRFEGGSVAWGFEASASYPVVSFNVFHYEDILERLLYLKQYRPTPQELRDAMVMNHNIIESVKNLVKEVYTDSTMLSEVHVKGIEGG